MRSFVLILTIGCLLPSCLFYPQVGMLVWGWLTLMSPHQEVYGLAQALQFNLVVAVVTLLAWLVSAEPKVPPGSAVLSAFILFVLLMGVSQLTAALPDYSFTFFDRFIREMVFIFLCLAMLNSKARIHAMLWIYAISIGYFAVKGGAFTLVSGGGYHVVGPPNSMIGDNNHIGLAVVMALPVMNYLRLQTANRPLRTGIVLAMVLSFICVLGTQSRGAFIGLAAMGLVLIWRSRHRTLSLVVIAAMAIPMVMFMPETWVERMETIGSATDDNSFNARVQAWWIAVYIALGDPLTGVGFRAGYIQSVADMFTGGGYVARAHHSIYFEILAAMGFLGLAVYLLIMFLTWRNAARVRRLARDRRGLEWAHDLASMAQATLAGYIVAGASMSVEFWAGYWLFVPILLHLRRLVEAEVVVGADAPSTALRRGPATAALEPRR
ncbi:MAG: putative O-glycosylation ligase, exosortase A system-associated [Tistlia sp.]|uniref:putative O-glycosylation ligase, exosortase A system-associated n=1 Tax=Tistlia sp. TaxID=3057121 RepID=UPI0034A39CD7